MNKINKYALWLIFCLICRFEFQLSINGHLYTYMTMPNHYMTFPTWTWKIKDIIPNKIFCFEPNISPFVFIFTYLETRRRQISVNELRFESSSVDYRTLIGPCQRNGFHTAKMKGTKIHGQSSSWGHRGLYSVLCFRHFSSDKWKIWIKSRHLNPSSKYQKLYLELVDNLTR